jgi:hypothetical protein
MSAGDFQFDESHRGQSGGGEPASSYAGPRYPMGLPRGSVRALLAIMILGLMCILLLLPASKDVRIPIYLYYLMFLILGHYFAARSHTPPGREPPPLHLPRGTIRLLILGAFVAVLGYSLYRNPSFVRRLNPSVEDLVEQPYLPLVMLAAFLGGILLTTIAKFVIGGRQGLPPWYQDIQAWLALLAVLGLGVEVIIHVVIYPNLAEPYQVNLPYWQSILTGIIAFYFGARS